MDKTVRQSNQRIDLVVDLSDKSAVYRGRHFCLSLREAQLLNCLVNRYPKPVRVSELRRLVGEGSFRNIRERLSEKIRFHGLTLKYDKRLSVQLIEKCPAANLASSPQPLQSLDIDSIEDVRPVFTTDSGAKKGRGFAISIDGIILNSASELIYGTVDVAQVRACRLLYRSSIEDLAFALVYGSRLSSKWRPRHEVATDLELDSADVPNEPAELLTSRLPTGLYSKDLEDERFRYGRVLEEEGARKQVGEYIASLGRAIDLPHVRELCREWLVREAKTYMGEDRSLFTSEKFPTEFRFAKKYYESPFLMEIPALLGQTSLETLTGFLPNTPHPVGSKRKTDRYSQAALRQFVLVNVLTHITTMYEYEQIAEEDQTHRLPFILRGAVKQQWHRDQAKERQLRTLLVRSALNEGLLQTRDAYGREELIQRLLWVRDDEQFIIMRSRLDEVSELVKEDRSKEIAKLVAEINSNKHHGPRSTDALSLSRNTIMLHPKIARVDPHEYMQRLESFFPELKFDP